MMKLRYVLGTTHSRVYRDMASIRILSLESPVSTSLSRLLKLKGEQ